LQLCARARFTITIEPLEFLWEEIAAMKLALALAFALLPGCKQGDSPTAESSPPRSTAAPASEAPAPAASTVVDPSASSASTAASPAQGASGAVWTFDADKTGAPPSGFAFGRTGAGKEGRWTVVAAADAPSKPNVLAQLDQDPTDYRFPVAFVDGSSFKDVTLSVSCKPVSGSVDQGCGLVWRLKDADNYYLTRANALEDNVRLYHVKDGKRIQFASWSGKVASKTWHKLRVDARGDRFEVYFDDKKILDAKDSTFSGPGKAGVWTKADSVIQFDDLAASPL
jgi:hypothetical protein